MANDVGLWGYERWSAELENHFLHVQPSHPIMLCVDAETLADLTGEDGDRGTVSLVRAVASQIMPGYRFGAVGKACEHWADGDRESAPPSLPLLAVTVLAASRMDRSNEVGSHNYYRRFRELLDSSDSQFGMPGNYGLVIPKLWRQLETWLNDELSGQRGILTLPSEQDLAHNSYLKNIGYALQHALFRASDRRRLAAFFRAVGLEPGEEEVEPVELRRTLALWARRRRPQAERLHTLATEEEHETYCLQLLQRQAQDWDGLLDDPKTGNPVSPMRLCLTTRPQSLGLVLPRDERMPPKTSIGWQDQVIELSGATSTPYFNPIPLPIPVTGEVLSKEFTLTGPAIGAVLEEKSIHAFRYDEYLGAWVSKEEITFGEFHYLLVHEDEVAGLFGFADSEGIEIRKIAAAAFNNVVPKRWNVVPDFCIRRRPSPEAKPPSAIATLLRSGGGPRLRLVGGLRVPEFPRAYLTGGAPLLALPADMESDQIILRRDSTHGTESLRPQGSEYPLDKLNLDEGLYYVECGAARLAFDMIDGLVETAGDGAGSVSTPGRKVDISGVHGCMRPELRPATVPAPSKGEQCVLVGPGPNDLEIVEIPIWLSELVGGGGLSWTDTAEWLSFEPVWRLTKPGPKADSYGVTRVGDADAPPQLGPHSALWVNLIKSSEPADLDADTFELWQQYATAAEATP